MKKKILIVLIASFTTIILSSCGGLSDAGKVLRNEKILNTDEFLVKKRAPLVLPPDFDILPKPGSANKSNQVIDDKKKINKLLKIPDNKSSSSTQVISAEKSILDKINK